jgi:cellulose synthase/poly-beta-1,6-N-acetylglucosamine synthase-like glycosyltransferase
VRFAQPPLVTIQLPIYNERYVIERLIDEVTKIEYPKELLQIQVLDDSTDDTHAHAEAVASAIKRSGLTSNTTTARIARDIRPERWPKVSRPRAANLLPSSTRISSRRPTFC